MRNKPKSTLLCLPDTNSLIHMHDIDVVNKKLWEWLWEEFDVRLSETIYNELHHPDKLMKKLCQKSIWNFRKQQRNLKNMENVFVKHFNMNLNNRKNIGECHNCCIALDAVLSGTYNQVIFLTDELKGTDPKRDGSLFRVFDSFPIGKIWSSLDFVLYLFARHRNRFHFQIAEVALNDINILIGGKSRYRNDVLTKRLRCYTRRLKEINETLSQLPPYPKIRS